MIYVTSDLHGVDPVQFQQLLDRAGFTDEDFLFVLGDVIDRGDHGIELLKWMSQQPNVSLILGNHEALMLACSFAFDNPSLDQLTNEEVQLLESWLDNGGGPTLKGLFRLHNEDPDLVTGILEYLQDAPLYECLEINGRVYVLVHSGLGNFRPDRRLSDYTPNELLFERPDLKTRYFRDATVVFGHTPTVYFGLENRGRAVRTDSWICIDTGVLKGDLPMLLRLDDEKEFY